MLGIADSAMESNPPTSTKTALWTGKDGNKSLNKDLFLDRMEKHWRDWACEKLSRAEKKAWTGITEIVYRGKVKAMTDLPEPDTWAEVTAYKVLFPGDEFLHSRYAALAQIRFPLADLARWEPNTGGPTAFKQNRFIKQKRLGEWLRQATELSKRAWAAESVVHPPPAKRPRNHPAAEEAPVGSVPGEEMMMMDGPLISKPEDVFKVFAMVEKQLASVRAAAEANTKIHQKAVDELRQFHGEELKKAQKHAEDEVRSTRESHRREMEDAQRAHEEELSKVCGTYEAAISTLNKACLDGIAALENARKKAGKACREGVGKTLSDWSQ